MENQNGIKKAYANLSSLRNNLPASKNVDKKYAEIFNAEINHLIKIGFDLEEFIIPDSEIQPRKKYSNLDTGEVKYSQEKYVDREIISMKLDSVLRFFQISAPEIEVGFRTD